MALYFRKTRSEFLSGISAAEYRELLAMNALEPIGFERLDFYLSRILSAWGEGDPETYDLSFVEPDPDSDEFVQRELARFGGA